MDSNESGIVVYRASRLEALLDPLQQLLTQVPPAQVLAPQTVIAAHPGMRHWLAAALARRRGPAGIVANLRIGLPSTWLDELARAELGEQRLALEAYRRERLRWLIHEALPTLDDAPLRGYLDGDDAARRRYQLADRLARLYGQYLVYRPDWLLAWQRGHDRVPEPTFMASLWRQLRQRIGKPHRGELVEELLAALASPVETTADEPLHLFGISHLAPSELALLRAVARRRPVLLYVPDPCREYWGGLRDDRTQLRERARRTDFGTASERYFLEIGHPLLASWGRMGQHFLLGLHRFDEAIGMDVRHGADEQPLPDSPSLLLRLQESIRQLDPALLDPLADGIEGALADRSLRVHLCHTRLRELEVLRDSLLRELAERPELQPADIVVMAPNIQAYVPLLPAVFGPPGRHGGPLPYHLADVAVARGHPLFEAFERLLATPQSRLGTPELLDLLQVPELARALHLDADELTALTQWLRQARVAWGLDGAHRADFGVPPIDEYTHAWGMDRLLAGYVLGDPPANDTTAWSLPDGELWPVEGVAGPQAAALGALDVLLLELAALRRDAAQPRRAAAWGERLEQLLDKLFHADPRDQAAVDALALLRRFIQATTQENQACGLDPLLDFSVVRQVLRERLAAAPERQRLLIGGVTFCGMVPQRAIPFQVIAVLGLDDGEFPRAAGDAGLDLMQRHRRLGDRDVRNDDRYLFLETVMAARELLHLSYIGEGVRDGKPRNPASPLAELLEMLDEQAGLRGLDASADDGAPVANLPWAPRRPWRIKHPLQPFDARYFDGRDPRLFSFDAGQAGMVGADIAPSAFLAVPSVSDIDVQPSKYEAPTLAQWRTYYQDPARQLLTEHLRLRLDALANDRLQSQEPLTDDFSALEQVPRRLFFEALEHGLEAPQQPPAWLRLSGLLPPGQLGARAWLGAREPLAQMLQQARALPLFEGAPPRRQSLPLEAPIAGVFLQGSLERIYDKQGERWLFEVYPGKPEAALNFKERIPLFIEWGLARLQTPATRRLRVCLLCVGEEHPWSDGLNAWDAALVSADDATARLRLAALERRLAELLAIWRAALDRPAWYFPKTSWAALEDRPQAVATAWLGGDYGHVGERDYAPGYARLLAGATRLQADGVEYAALRALATRLCALIEFSAEPSA